MNKPIHMTALDAALVARYSGIYVLIEGVSTEVEVFIESPATEYTRDRTYPSISIQYAGDVPDFEQMDSDDDVDDELDIDLSETPGIATTRKSPEPTRVRYTVDVWVRNSAAIARELNKEVYRKRTPSRGSLQVTNIDGTTQKVWYFRVPPAQVEVDDYSDVDMRIYHHSLMVEALVNLSQVEYDDTTETPVVEEALWDVQSRRYVPDRKGQVGELIESKDITDRVIRITEDTEEEGSLP
jgi:hypothetical protein